MHPNFTKMNYSSTFKEIPDGIQLEKEFLN